MTPEERLLRRVANLVALRHQVDNRAGYETILQDVASLLSAAGYADAVDAF